MKNYLRTSTFCGKIQGSEEPCWYLQIFVGLYWNGLETERQIAKNKIKLKRKKEKLNKKNMQTRNREYFKPKLQACLNSQAIRKVAN